MRFVLPAIGHHHRDDLQYHRQRHDDERVRLRGLRTYMVNEQNNEWRDDWARNLALRTPHGVEAWSMALDAIKARPDRNALRHLLEQRATIVTPFVALDLLRAVEAFDGD